MTETKIQAGERTKVDGKKAEQTGHTPKDCALLSSELQSAWNNGDREFVIFQERDGVTVEVGSAMTLKYCKLFKAAPELLQTIKDIQHNAQVMNRAEPNRVWTAIDDACNAAICLS